LKILVIANHYAVASGHYITDAFTRAGHEVRHSGPAMGRTIWGLRLPTEYVWTPDAIEEGWTPDLTVIADSDPSLLDAPVKLPAVVWGVDNHVRNYRRSYIDHYFLAHFHGQCQPISSSRTDETWLPCAYDPTLFTPSAIPFAERAYDVAILGYMYPQRRAAVKALQEAGLRVIWGCGLVGESYVKAHHNARISLCLSARGDVAIRIFESAAMGCVVMSDYCADFDLLQPEGIWLIDDINALVDDVREILSQTAIAQTSIEKALQWVKPHTWDARVKVIEAMV